MLLRDGGFGREASFAGIEDDDLGGEVLGLENDGGGEVGERAAGRDFPLGFHGLGGFPEEGLVALVADQAEVLVATGLLEDDGGEFFFGGGELLTGLNAFRLKKPLLDQLCATRLDGEVGLGEGYFLLPRIAILRDEVAGVAGEHEIVDFPLRAFGQLDHFVDVNKMIRDRETGHFAGGFRLGNRRLIEVPPLRVSEQMLDVAGEPVFHPAFRLLGVVFEVCRQAVDEVGFHASRRSVTFSGIWAIQKAWGRLQPRAGWRRPIAFSLVRRGSRRKWWVQSNA